ncbi:MAG: DNA-methyltransferase [Bacillota bacterium]
MLHAEPGKQPGSPWSGWALSSEATAIGRSLIVLGDSLEWLRKAPEESIHAVVTDPPYGVREYHIGELAKRNGGRGGVWRIPPAFDGHLRSPLPRFTALDARDRSNITEFFYEWAKLVTRVLRPGGHVIIASNSFISQLTFSALVQGGLEFRGELIRLVRTLRGGDRPKNAESEFADVSSLPRGCYEPWGLFRKPLPPRFTVSECLREYGTGGLRRQADGRPFEDVIVSERTPKLERSIANHPSIKPQSFMRRVVYASLPLGEGVILDPFMGSGSTIAAAEAMGLTAIGVERVPEYYFMAQKAIPRLSALRDRSEPRDQLKLL